MKAISYLQADFELHLHLLDVTPAHV